jgi:hypothetical protein
MRWFQHGWALSASLLLACEGGGDGQLSGTLFVRGCPSLDPTGQSATDVPSPIPDFRLDPHAFFAEVVWGIRTGYTQDRRSGDRLQIRMQRSSNKLDRSDGLELLVHDLRKLQSLQDDSLRAGLPGIPVIPPALDQSMSPLPPSPDAAVRAGLVLNHSCRYPLTQPSLRGFIRFTEFGHVVGETLAGEFDVSVEDLRAKREQGDPPTAPNVAGAMHGWFRIPLRSGPAVAAQ